MTRSACMRAAAVCAVMSTGCGEGGPAATVNGPTPVTAPRVVPGAGSVLADATLSGVVYQVISESPRQIAGIEGVGVYCEPCGKSSHNWAYTDSNGAYIFPRGVWTEGRPQFPIRVLVQKDSYGDPPGLPRPTPPNPSGPGWREVQINGDTRFEIELVPR